MKFKLINELRETPQLVITAVKWEEIEQLQKLSRGMDLFEVKNISDTADHYRIVIDLVKPL